VKGDEGDGELANFDVKAGNTKWCICEGNCVPMLMADECFYCQELEALNQKFDESGVECITNHAKFRIVPGYRCAKYCPCCNSQRTL